MGASSACCFGWATWDAFMTRYWKMKKLSSTLLLLYVHWYSLNKWYHCLQAMDAMKWYVLYKSGTSGVSLKWQVRFFRVVWGSKGHSVDISTIKHSLLPFFQGGWIKTYIQNTMKRRWLQFDKKPLSPVSHGHVFCRLLRFEKWSTALP